MSHIQQTQVGYWPTHRACRQTLIRVFTVAVVSLGLVAPLVATTSIASADTLSRLSRTLRKAKSPKARVSAVVALARLKDTRAVKPLIRALKDSNRSVRATAATALGHLGNRKALSALRRAARDSDEAVSSRAEAAIVRIGKSPKPTPKKNLVKTRGTPRLSRMRSDASESPKRSDSPELFVTVKSVADKSPGRVKTRTRKRYARKMRSLLEAELDGSGRVTSKTTEAKRLRLRMFQIDASIIKYQKAHKGRFIVVECEIRLTISNERGKMLSFLSSGAKVKILRDGFKRQFLAQMRKDALNQAVKKVHRDLMAFLTSARRSS